MKNTLSNREKRIMNKVRKRRAELMLLSGSSTESSGAKKKRTANGQSQCASQGQSTIVRDVKSAENSADQARTLGREIREKLAERELQSPHPSRQVNAILQLEKLRGQNLNERELAAFLHRMALGTHNAPRGAVSNWIRFGGGKKPLQYLLVRVNCHDKEILKTKEDAKFMDEYFQRKWVLLSQSARDRLKFWQAISCVIQSRNQLLIQKIRTSCDPMLSVRMPERKTQLLMSLEQMVNARYPFPTDASEDRDGSKKQSSNEPNIAPTRSVYRRPNEHSPIFVIDCEMCQTSADRLELTRISMINEEGDTLIDTLVKPHNKIVNYLTHKSGITEKMLAKVTTKLKDVQHKLRSFLTDDAILCGHSLENDLLALGLSHPFCIDTSLLFNFSGRPHIRSGLKALAKIFLNEDIQVNDGKGHCSLQDAQTTLKLLRLKLEKGLEFGNVALGWPFAEWAKANGMTTTGTRLCELEMELAKNEADGEKLLATIKVEECELESSGFESSSNISDITQQDANFMGDNLVEHKNKNIHVKCQLFTKEEREEMECNSTPDEPNASDDVVAPKDKATTNEEKACEANGKGKHDEELFDFIWDAVHIDNGMQRIAKFTDCFHFVNEGKRAKKMLVAMPEPEKFFTANESCSLVDLASDKWSEVAESSKEGEEQSMPSSSTNADGNMLNSICTRVASKLMNFDFIFLELDCPAGTPKRDLDDAFKTLTQGVCNNAMVICVLAERKVKEGKAVMYQRIHRKNS